MEFYIIPQSGQFYMINVLENQWLSVTYIDNAVGENPHASVSVTRTTTCTWKLTTEQ